MQQARLLSGITHRSPSSAWEQHTVVHNTEDLDHAVRRHAVNENMSRRCHALARRNKLARELKMEGSQPIQARHLSRPGEIGSISYGRCGREDQAMVSRRREDAPTLSALQQDGVDTLLCVTDQAVGH